MRFPGVSFTFTAPAAGAGGTFEGGGNAVTMATNSSGIAAATTFTANAVTGSYTVTATSAGLPMVSFALTNSAIAVAPAVTALGVADPATGILGSMLSGSSVTFDGVAAPIVKRFGNTVDRHCPLRGGRRNCHPDGGLFFRAVFRDAQSGGGRPRPAYMRRIRPAQARPWRPTRIPPPTRPAIPPTQATRLRYSEPVKAKPIRLASMAWPRGTCSRNHCNRRFRMVSTPAVSRSC